MFLKLANLPSKLRFSGKYLLHENPVSAGQLSADGSSTETLQCYTRELNFTTQQNKANRQPLSNESNTTLFDFFFQPSDPRSNWNLKKLVF